MSAASAGLSSWRDLEARDPDMAAAAHGLLCPKGDIAIGFLATVSHQGVPHIAPVCPIFCDDWLYLSVGADSPKRRDLDRNGRYALHAFLGARDTEFQLTGAAELVEATEQRERVHRAIRFGAFGPDDPIYRLWIERALYVIWEKPGQPGTRPLSRRYRA